MAFNTTTYKVASKQLVKVMETTVSGKIALTDERIIDKALIGEGFVNIVSEDKIGENILISGEVKVNALFLSSGKIDSEETKIEFSERITLGELEATNFVPKLKSVKINKDTDKILSVVCVVETRVYGVSTKNENVLVGEGDNFYASSTPIKLNNLTSSTSTSFIVSDNFDLNCSKILSVTPITAVTKITPFDNYCLVEGSSNLDFLVVVDEQVKKITKTIDFSEEIAVLNMSPTSKVEFNVYNKNITCTLNNEDEGNKCVCDLMIGVAVWGFNETEVNVIKDIFSDTKEILPTYSTIQTIEINENKIFSERKSIVSLQDVQKRIDEVVFVGAVNTSVESVIFADGVLNIEGVLNVPVVFKNYDGDDTNLTYISEPFNLNFPVTEKEGEVVFDVNLCAHVNSLKNKAGKDITLFIDFDGVISSTCMGQEQYVSVIDEGADFGANRSSIVVYKPTKNESVFEIAKKLQVSPDILRAQNPQIDDDKQLAQVVVFRKIN